MEENIEQNTQNPPLLSSHAQEQEKQPFKEERSVIEKPWENSHEPIQSPISQGEPGVRRKKV